MRGIKTKAAGKTIQNLSYDYDARLNPTRRTDLLQGKTEHFGYDLLDRLTVASFGPGVQEVRTYSYQPNGNLTAKPGLGIYTYDPARPHAVQEAGGETYAYDAVGNQIARPGATIEYTGFDLPSSFTVNGEPDAIRLQYDGHQQRIRKVTPTAETIYVGGLYERVTDVQTGAVEHRYHVFSSERMIAIVTRKTGKPQKKVYVHVDNLGSVDVLTDEAGAVVERRSYDAFGERRNPAWGGPPILIAGKTSRGFTGHEDDEELGLVNMRGRLYDPHLGRFLTPDPFVSRPHFSQSWNKFSYALNNPLAYVDPTGFAEDDSHAADPFPGFTPWTPWPGDPVHVTITPGVNEDAATDGPLEAAEAGASSVPLDVAATGNVAGAVPQPSPIGNVLPRGVSNAIDFILGVHDAADEFAYNAGKALALNALTFGGYGTYQLGNTLWNGYKEDGILGALNAVNPAALIKEGWNRTLDQIDRGDYRAAGREG
ncbi:MAG TPA: RHS repeat-associated core domain-containing protein, partial [Streptomyces sp.]|nr:RHS repeat-associated core domain-containing protein [Streptomyces sp.]